MMPVPPLGSPDNPRGPHRIERDGWVITELPPLTGRMLGRALLSGGAWPFCASSPAAGKSAFRDQGVPAVFTLHPWELDPAHPPMDGLPAATRAVFGGLKRFPERLTRWLARDRCVAIADVLPLLVPA